MTPAEKRVLKAARKLMEAFDAELDLDPELEALRVAVDNLPESEDRVDLDPEGQAIVDAANEAAASKLVVLGGTGAERFLTGWALGRGAPEDTRIALAGDVLRGYAEARRAASLGGVVTDDEGLRRWASLKT